MNKIVTYGVISDTHGWMPSTVFDAFAGVAGIFHCGDVGAVGLAEELEVIAPVRVVHGNMDWGPIASQYPADVIEDLEFGTVAMTHGTRFGHRNEAIVQGLLRQYAAVRPRLILFGHSHVPLLLVRGNTMLLNPGSASEPRAGHSGTVAVVTYDPVNDSLSAEHLAV